MPSKFAPTEPSPVCETFLNGSAREPNRARLQHFRRFLLWLFLLPGILYLTAIPLVRTHSYYRWAPSHYGPSLDFGFNTENENADVVIFGDSSAFLGIDPRLINLELKLKTLVLPNTAGSLPVVGDQALRFYLDHNRRPRLIVLYLTAWDLDYAHSADTHLYEGEEMLLRHGSFSQIADFVRARQLEFAAFPLRSYSSLGPGVLKTLIRGINRQQQTADALGHTDDSENYPPLTASCNIPRRDTDAQQTATANGLASKYREQGYKLAIYLAPLPACRNASLFAGRTYDNLASAPPVALPPEDFLADGLYAHLEPASVTVASHLLASSIERQLRLSSPVDHSALNSTSTSQ